MSYPISHLLKRIIISSTLLTLVLCISILLGLSFGSTDHSLYDVTSVLLGREAANSMVATIIWDIRFPRVFLAALVGATLALGGLVFQALLRNPLAEPYILGVSGGSAVGAIIGILAGLSRFPGVSLVAFMGGAISLFIILLITPYYSSERNNSLLLTGVMVNALFSAIIMFLLSITQDSRLHTILFWLMGDLSIATMDQVVLLLTTLAPCFVIVFILARPMNLLLMGEETAMTIGVPVKKIMIILLITTSLMISATVCTAGLIGFVGLVMPHMLRLVLGPDHRVLVPASIIGGASFMVLCDLLARSLPAQGEMPVGVVTAMIGAPLFIFLLQRSKR